VSLRTVFDSLSRIDELNFLLTNRIPRRIATLAMGRFSRIEHPFVRDPSIALFRFFCDELELHEAKKSRFKSLHDCFVRELKPGARPIERDGRSLVSPCDGIIGAHGRIDGARAFQAKGFPYRLPDLLPDPALVEKLSDGRFVTLRLKANMYHRFHAPDDLRVTRVTYVSGDVWNVNPPALARIRDLYCRNERVVLEARTAGGTELALVAVAAILVASVRLRFLDVTMNLRYRGPNVIDCDAPAARGEELGHFEHGSTILLFTPPGFEMVPGTGDGRLIRMGQPLLQRT
jgi:phosphatidylserine decarboxylase